MKIFNNKIHLIILALNLIYFLGGLINNTPSVGAVLGRQLALCTDPIVIGVSITFAIFLFLKKSDKNFKFSIYYIVGSFILGNLLFLIIQNFFPVRPQPYSYMLYYFNAVLLYCAIINIFPISLGWQNNK